LRFHILGEDCREERLTFTVHSIVHGSAYTPLMCHCASPSTTQSTHLPLCIPIHYSLHSLATVHSRLLHTPLTCHCTPAATHSLTCHCAPPFHDLLHSLTTAHVHNSTHLPLCTPFPRLTPLTCHCVLPSLPTHSLATNHPNNPNNSNNPNNP
jgi:hypothetical protein